MGDSSDAGVAPLRTSVVSLTNGPSIMILGRLGVFSTPVRLSQTRSVSLARFSLGEQFSQVRSTSTPVRRACPFLRTTSGTAGVKMCNGVALRGTCRSPGVTPRARSLGRYTLPPRRRVDEQHPPRTETVDAVHSLTPTGPTAFLCSHPCRRKGV